MCGDLDFVGEGGEGKHISLAAIFEGKHISLVICVRGHTYHGETHITVTPVKVFKTPRKCSIFGVCCEAIPRQVNFLVDESVLTGKGANSTISLVHYFFQNFGLGETDAYIHADNCAGQNKNNYFLWYYAWRVIVGLHCNVLYSFLVAGHTKFSPDWCFGLAKQAVRKTFISDLFELARTIDNSTVTGVNVAQLCGLHDGSVTRWFIRLGYFS